MCGWAEAEPRAAVAAAVVSEWSPRGGHSSLFLSDSSSSLPLDTRSIADAQEGTGLRLREPRRASEDPGTMPKPGRAPSLSALRTVPIEGARVPPLLCLPAREAALPPLLPFVN